MAKCWQNKFSSPASTPPLLTDISLGSPGNSDLFLGSRFADEVSRLDTIFSSYLVGCLYTALILRDMRGEFGVYYTPPAISRHLMDLAEQAGTDWGSARVLDPACGGGAFLAPLARRMLLTLEGRNTPDPSEPWAMPRTQEQARLVQRTWSMPTRLRDLGFKVSTGPLVWNRHKPQLRDDSGPGHYPLIWAESVSADGSF